MSSPDTERHVNVEKLYRKAGLAPDLARLIVLGLIEEEPLSVPGLSHEDYKQEPTEEELKELMGKEKA